MATNTVRAYATDLLQVFQLKGDCQLLGPKLNGDPNYGVNIDNPAVLSTPYAEWPALAQQGLRKLDHLVPRSKKRLLSAISGFAQWLEEFENIPFPITWEGPSTPPRKLPHFISVDEVMSLVEYLKNKEPSPITQQETLLFYLLYGSGLRVSEACQLKWSAVQWSQRQLRIFGKGGKERLAILPLPIVELLKKAKTKIQGDYIWGDKPLPTRTAYERIRQLGKQSGLLQPLHPHALRHSFATHLLNSGSDLRVLQQLLGHQSLSATELYTHLDHDHLARTLESFHPLSDKD